MGGREGVLDPPPPLIFNYSKEALPNYMKGLHEGAVCIIM